METDAELYRCYLDGDEKGLRKLIEKYGNNLTLYIKGYIHDINEAEDLMIEAFARVAAKKPILIDRGFKSYLFKTGRNLALRHLSKYRLSYHFGFDDLGHDIESGQLLEDEVQAKELNHILQLSMEQISPNYREALFLVYIEGMSYAQAGQIMKKTKKQIANLVCRGKQAMRPILVKEGIKDAQH